MVDFKIEHIEERDNKLHVTVETAYGTNTLRFDVSMKSLHITTNKPEWLHAVRDFVDKKYSRIAEPKKPKDKDLAQFKGMSFSTDEIESKDRKHLAQKVRENSEQRLLLRQQRHEEHKLQIKQEIESVRARQREKNELLQQLRSAQKDMTETEKLCEECEEKKVSP